MRVPKGGSLDANLDSSGQMLTVKGKGTNERGNWIFERSTTLPFRCEPENLDIQFEEGVNEATLTVRVPTGKTGMGPESKNIQIKGMKHIK